jgi:transposase-like protein
LETQAGVVDLKVPKLRKLPLESTIIDRYRPKESSVEEALVEMWGVGAAAVKTIHASEDRAAACGKVEAVASEVWRG